MDARSLNVKSLVNLWLTLMAIWLMANASLSMQVIVAGLIPIMIGTGTGSEVMQRIAAPMVGGMITAPLLSLFVVPAVYFVWKRRDFSR